MSAKLIDQTPSPARYLWLRFFRHVLTAASVIGALCAFVLLAEFIRAWLSFSPPPMNPAVPEVPEPTLSRTPLWIGLALLAASISGMALRDFLSAVIDIAEYANSRNNTPEDLEDESEDPTPPQ